MPGIKPRTITIDGKSIEAANSGQLDLSSIVEDLELPEADLAIICTTVGAHGFVLSPSFQPTDTLLTIDLAKDGPLTALRVDERIEALQRMIRCTTRIALGKSRSIPPKWRPYHAGNLLTFEADRFERRSNGEKASAGRIVLEIKKEFGYHVFGYLLDRSGNTPLDEMIPPVGIIEEVIAALPNALTVGAPGADDNDGTYNLEGRWTEVGSRSRTADGWYSQLLTSAQRRFVDHDMSDGVRLTGAAGTGKTRTLAVKATRLIEDTNKAHRRILVLTHASQTVADVERMILEMSPDLGLQALADEPARLVVTTIYALANSVMNFRLKELAPIILDGHSGKRFQAGVLNKTIERYRNGEWLAYVSACSEPFVEYMSAEADSNKRKFFLWELLNEFACVIDAIGVRVSPEKRRHYLTERRKPGMMPLLHEAERRVVLALYDQFRAEIRAMKALGSDQMITDFLNFVDTYQWDMRRDSEGFDVILVDELHLFNRQERMAFHHLSRTAGESASIAFAYDAKQSPRNTFLELPSMEAQSLDLWKDAHLPKGERIELVDVFRYTPQIALALKKIDDSLPGQSLDEDWPPYAGVSKTDAGPVPTISVLPTIASYGAVLRRAKQYQNNLSGNGRVAVLFLNSETFQAFIEREEVAADAITIASRDDAASNARSRKRYVVSMPEYVAGLQYDTVLLLDGSQHESPEGPYTAALQRAFVAQVYLGASRAEKRLEIFAVKEMGGISSIFTKAVLAGAIVEAELPGQ
jgi:hypothetical protein